MRTFNHVRRSLLQVLLLMLLAYVISAALSIAVIWKKSHDIWYTGHEDYWNNLARAKQAEIDAKTKSAGTIVPPKTPKPDIANPPVTPPTVTIPVTKNVTSVTTSVTTIIKPPKRNRATYMRRYRARTKTTQLTSQSS
jgi:hypothetical protein